MSFDLDSYVDVAQRISEFYAAHPTGSLKSGEAPKAQEIGGKWFVIYHAQAFRTPDDPCPADGWAWEPVPGPTQFTKDSELQNAETAAWGRAIVACGFETKKIASREEMQNRAGDAATHSPPASPAESPVARAQAAAEAAKEARTPQDDGKPENVEITFGKHKGLTLGSIERGYLEWLIGNFEPKDAEQRRIIMAAQSILGVATEPITVPDDDIPF